MLSDKYLFVLLSRIYIALLTLLQSPLIFILKYVYIIKICHVNIKNKLFVINDIVRLCTSKIENHYYKIFKRTISKIAQGQLKIT